MGGSVLLVYAIGFIATTPLSAYCWYKICLEEEYCEHLENADGGDNYESQKQSNVLGTAFLMFVAGTLWPIMLVVMPGIIFYLWFSRKKHI